MKKIFRIGAVMYFMFIVPLAFAIDGNELLKKIDRNLNPESFEMYRKLINIEPDGSKKEYIMYSVKKGRDKIAS
ncbi:MAG: outer membrane lipoprotein-sorting protein, partial [Thermodesulfobacteriota bacterium]|nr:outer membrane lipoprotein-sorting protein [Thermodesulfobacteriota bacterium]